MQPDSQIVIGPDGRVLAATGRLPSDLVDVRLDECGSLSPEIREAGTAVLRQLHDGPSRIATQTVADGGDRMVQVVAVEALLLRRTATDLRALLASKLDVLSSQAAADGVTLSVVAADDLPATMQVDGEKLAWAITALVGSALRYLQSGSRRIHSGTVSVRAGFDPGNAQVTIEVQDDGPGIPADTVRRLFRRDGLNVRGSGLALLLISDICAAHGGRVEVHSNTGSSDHGTTVRLILPARA